MNYEAELIKFANYLDLLLLRYEMDAMAEKWDEGLAEALHDEVERIIPHHTNLGRDKYLGDSRTQLLEDAEDNNM